MLLWWAFETEGPPDAPRNCGTEVAAVVAGELIDKQQRHAEERRWHSLDPEGRVIRRVREGAEHVADGRELPIAV